MSDEMGYQSQSMEATRLGVQQFGARCFLPSISEPGQRKVG